MKRMPLIYLLFFLLTWLACSGSRELVPTRARQVKTTQVIGYHAPVELTIAWYPYQELEFKQKKDRNWVIFSDTAQYRGGMIPMILVTYPESKDSIWMDMHVDTRLLGNLIKHTLMTQEPIQRPFGQYLDRASCTKCHPKDIQVDFN